MRVAGGSCFLTSSLPEGLRRPASWEIVWNLALLQAPKQIGFFAFGMTILFNAVRIAAQHQRVGLVYTRLPDDAQFIRVNLRTLVQHQKAQGQAAEIHAGKLRKP